MATRKNRTYRKKTYRRRQKGGRCKKNGICNYSEYMSVRSLQKIKKTVPK